MKILLLCEHIDGTDGWSRHTRNLAEALQKRGHDICCYTAKQNLKSQIPNHSQFSILNSQLPSPLRLLTRPFLAPLLARKLTDTVQKEQPDIIHITVEPYALLIPFLPKDIVARTILTIHGNYGIRPLRWWMTRFLAQRYYARISRFITVSHYTKNAVLKELERLRRNDLAQHFKKHATVIHNGIQLPTKNKKLEIRNKKQILHVGGVKPVKGVLEAIEACAVYKEKFGTPFMLSVIGRMTQGDTYVERVRQRVQECGLQESVTLCGFITEQDLQEAYKESDLLLLPSRTAPTTFEGFGLVYLEANAYGVPVIGPNTSGAAEAIEEGVSGYQVDNTNPDEIAERMHWVLDEKRIDPKQCRTWAEKHSMEGVAEKVENVYNTIHARSPSRSHGRH